jgi:hypothetical protein
VRAAIGSGPVGPAWPVDEIVVFESFLRPQGARHVARARIPIGPFAADPSDGP